jgi:hypothetical protein
MESSGYKHGWECKWKNLADDMNYNASCASNSTDVILRYERLRASKDGGARDPSFKTPRETRGSSRVSAIALIRG